MYLDVLIEIYLIIDIDKNLDINKNFRLACKFI